MTVFDWRDVDVRLGSGGQVWALRGVSLRIEAGERVVSAGVNSLKPGQKVKLDEDSPR